MTSFHLRDFLIMVLLVSTLLLVTELSVLRAHKPAAADYEIEDDDSPTAFTSLSSSKDIAGLTISSPDEDTAIAPKNKRTVTYIDYRSMITKNHTDDAYSGMWWAKRDLFEQKWERPYWEMAVKASFGFFDRVEQKNVLLTKDWMDFNVEHLSHYFKYMTMTEKVFARHVEKQVHYQQQQQQLVPPPKSGFATTLAIMPYYRGNNDSYEEYQTLQHVPQKQRRKYLYMLSIASTLVSLHNVGIPRAILTGNTMDEPPEIHQAIAIAQNHTKGRAMQVSYVPIFDKDMFGLHTPTKALDQLQAALNNTMPKIRQRQWLGNDPDEIQYIYFSEPDLILHAREHEQLTSALDAGMVMAAHRFQILPHQADFPDNERPNELLPDTSTLADFVDLDTDHDSCCDAGNYWPGLDEHELCKVGGNVWWYRCGQITANKEMNTSELYEQHFRLNDYPIIRLTNGIQAPVVQEHSRMCRPTAKGDQC